MAGSEFPYRAAYVACNPKCGVNPGDPCRYGCVGCGQCVEVCDSGAARIIDGIAVIDRDKCTACGRCIEVCPRAVIRINEITDPIVVVCSNREPAAAAKQQCTTSCIGCGLCAKSCCSGAAKVEEGLAVIDRNLCLSCGLCAVQCPRGAIADLRGILT